MIGRGAEGQHRKAPRLGSAPRLWGFDWRPTIPRGVGHAARSASAKAMQRLRPDRPPGTTRHGGLTIELRSGAVSPLALAGCQPPAASYHWAMAGTTNLKMRRTVIAGQYCADDWCVFHERRMIGRIYSAIAPGGARRAGAGFFRLGRWQPARRILWTRLRAHSARRGSLGTSAGSSM